MLLRYRVYKKTVPNETKPSIHSLKQGGLFIYFLCLFNDPVSNPNYAALSGRMIRNKLERMGKITGCDLI
jgi:hypothetical protein